MKRCPLCFGEIQDEAIKCRHCKSMIGSAASDAASPPPLEHLPQTLCQTWSPDIGGYDRPAETTIGHDLQGVKPGIRGWLLVFTIALALGCVDAVRKISEFLLAADPFDIPLNRLIFPCDILLFFIALFALYFLLAKKVVAPAIFILFRLFSMFTGFLIFYGAVYYQMQFTAESTSNFALTIGEAIGSLVIVPYFVLSKRVRTTFVQPLNKENILDRLWIPLLPQLEQLSAFLWKTKRFIFLELIAFIFAAMILSHALAMLLR